MFCWYSIYISKEINWKSILLKTVLSVYSNGKKLLNDGIFENNPGHLNFIRATSWFPLARIGHLLLKLNDIPVNTVRNRGFSADLFVIHKLDTFVRHRTEWFHKYDQIITSDVHRTIKTCVVSKLFRQGSPWGTNQDSFHEWRGASIMSNWDKSLLVQFACSRPSVLLSHSTCSRVVIDPYIFR